MRMTTAALAALLSAMLVAPASSATSASAAPAPRTTLAERSESAERVAISRVKQQVIALTNQRRTNRGCRPVRNHPALNRAAQAHSRRMAAAQQMSHQLPGEPGLAQRATRAGYTNWSMLGENIAYGYPTPRAVVRAWMQSPGHRRNILNCRLRDLGVGVVLEKGQLWWTQNFGRRYRACTTPLRPDPVTPRQTGAGRHVTVVLSDY